MESIFFIFSKATKNLISNGESSEEDDKELEDITNYPLMYISIVINIAKLFLYIILLLFHYQVSSSNPIRKRLSLEMIFAGIVNIISYFISYFNEGYVYDEPTDLCKAQAFIGIISQYYFMYVLCIHTYVAYEVINGNFTESTKSQNILTIIGFTISLVVALFSTGLFHFKNESVGPNPIRYCRLNNKSMGFQKIFGLVYYIAIVIFFYLFYCKLRMHVKTIQTHKKKDKNTTNKIKLYFKQLRVYSISALITTIIFLFGLLSVFSEIFGYNKETAGFWLVIDLIVYIIEVIAYPILTYIFSGITWKDIKNIFKCANQNEIIFENLTLEESMNQEIENIANKNEKRGI